MAFQRPYVPGPLRGKGDSAISKKPGPMFAKPSVKATPSAQIRSQRPGNGGKPPIAVSSKRSSVSNSSDSSSSRSDSFVSDLSSSKSNKSEKEKKMPRDKKSRSGSSNYRGMPGAGNQRPRQSGTEFPGAIKASDTNPPSKGPKNYLHLDGGSPLTFGTNIPSTLTLNEHNSSNYPLALEVTPRLHVNVVSASTAISNAATPSNSVTKFIDTIYYRFNRDILARARSAAVTTALNSPNFRFYIREVARGLALYYALDSINVTDTRASVGFRDKNAAFQLYQQKFDDPAILTAKNNLALALGNMWFPPKYHKLIAWMYQNYLTSDCEQALWIRNVPEPIMVYDSTGAWSASAFATLIGTVTTNIKTTNNSVLSSALSLTYNSGVMTGLYDSASKPVYDANFLEIFANTPTRFENNFQTAAETVVPFSVFGSVTDLPYFTNRKPETSDGFCLALHQTFYGTVQAGSNYLGTRDTTNIDYCTMFEPIIATALATTNRSCKYAYNASSDTFVARNSYIYNSGGVDAVQIHSLAADYRANCSPVSGWQRVYFVNHDAPRINQGYLIDELFGLEITSP